MYRRSTIIGQLRDEDKWKKKKKNHASLAVTMFTNFNVIYSKLYKKLQPAHYSLSLICLEFYPFYLHSNTILWKLWIMFNVNLQPNKLFSYGFPEATKYKLDRARYSKKQLETQFDKLRKFVYKQKFMDFNRRQWLIQQKMAEGRGEYIFTLLCNH